MVFIPIPMTQSLFLALAEEGSCLIRDEKASALQGLGGPDPNEE